MKWPRRGIVCGAKWDDGQTYGAEQLASRTDSCQRADSGVCANILAAVIPYAAVLARALRSRRLRGEIRYVTTPASSVMNLRWFAR